MNKGLSLKIYKVDIELFFIFLILIKPAMAGVYPVADNFFNGMRIIITLYLAVNLLRVNISKPLIIVALYCFAMLLPTIIYKGDFVKAGNYMMSAADAILVLTVYKKHINNVIKMVLFVLEIYILINVILMILYPDGLYMYDGYKCWLLGMKNNFASYFLCAICMELIYSNIRVVRRLSWLYAAIFISSLIGGSSTLFVVLAVFVGMLYLSNTRYKKYINYKVLTIIYIIIFFGIVIFRLQNLFEFIIVDILNKDLTFTNRTYIWDKAIEAFMNHKLFGVGIQSGERWARYIILEHAQVHNQILDYAFNGGILLLAASALLNISIGKNLMNKKGNMIAIVLSITTFLYHTTMLTESLYAFWMYIVFFLGFFVNDIINLKETTNNAAADDKTSKGKGV